MKFEKEKIPKATAYEQETRKFGFFAGGSLPGCRKMPRYEEEKEKNDRTVTSFSVFINTCKLIDVILRRIDFLHLLTGKILLSR